jgi:hypothetical protein
MRALSWHEIDASRRWTTIGHDVAVDDGDIAVRNLTYASFVDLGRAPTVDEVALRAGSRAPDVATAWRRLHDAHALVLGDSGALRMANPFSAVPTRFRVHAAGRWWYANCGWDAFGICAALHTDGRIESACPDCDQAIEIELRDARPDDGDVVFHCLVPAAHWWDDIVFT